MHCAVEVVVVISFCGKLSSSAELVVKRQCNTGRCGGRGLPAKRRAIMIVISRWNLIFCPTLRTPWNGDVFISSHTVCKTSKASHHAAMRQNREKNNNEYLPITGAIVILRNDKVK
ncbi:hypothetical protein EX30DRAFT_351403 [Ascodesmis nigricans]|uniref:Uncharacterized protein n=1 Tax=Ascodesmis nigricans TaxID=341454 RepID=A0A4S2MM04_9PEZI|nr:hypothetical protein EX30DRAFT_351403 [Ascodesmis nigricans]